MRSKKLLIGAFIALAAVGYLIYVLLGTSLTYYSTVSELKGQGSEVYDKGVRVNGEVADGFVYEGLDLSFTLTGEGDSLPVVYTGVIPDTFMAGAEVVVEGYLESSGVFQANLILAKCPSKYVAEG